MCRCMTSSGDMTRCVVPSRQGVLSFNTTYPAALVCTAKMGQSRFVSIIRDQLKTARLNKRYKAWRSKAA
jgi:hypothetical protein